VTPGAHAAGSREPTLSVEEIGWWYIEQRTGGAVLARTTGLILIFCILIPAAVVAQAIDRPAATVRLHKLDVISVRQLRTQLEVLESRTGQPVPEKRRRSILDLLVGEKLFEQAAEQARVEVTAADVAERIDQLRQQESERLNLGRPLTLTEYQSLVSQTGLSWSEYQEQLRKALIQQRYVARVRGDELRSVPLPTDADVLEFYEANKTTVFVQPDMVQFQHIYFDTRQLADAAARLVVRERAERVHRELQNGADFGAMVREHSEDVGSRDAGGTFGTYLRRDDRATSQLLGQEFFEAPFAMDVGQISGVLRSNVGFHIIEVTDKVGAKILGLDDPVNPLSRGRVRDRIRVLLANSVQAQAYQNALLATLEELRDGAEVRIFDANLRW
jgi:parvulin-like peptidyl-prolyl isomerase